MHTLLDLFKNLTDAEWINAHGGLYIVLFILFAETGLFVGFFLPGDSLLFVSGMIISKSDTPFASPVANLLYWIVLMTAAGILGNIVGYWFGNKSGHMLMKRKDTMLFKKKHLIQAHDFYEKKGGMAILLARFLPIVRTFAPIVGGMVDMNYKKFMFFNIVGSFAWVASMTITGFLLGKNVWVQHNLEKIVIIIIVITTGPVLLKMFLGKKKPETSGTNNP
ncbi:MAG: VTT domain-containing protein [Bacteroidota bacterium]